MVGQLKIDIESIGIKEKQNIISNDLNILQEKVKKLILIYPHPSYNNVVKDTVLKEINQSFFNTNKFRIYKNTAVKISIEDYKLNTKNAFEVFDSVEGGNVIRIYPAQVLCDEKYCYGKKKGEGIYTYDGFHLSITGAEKVFKLIEGYLSE
jgi:hypothetical protein